MPFTIRPAVPGDAPIVCEMIRELANYERLAHEAQPDEQALADHLARRARTRCEALLAIDTETETAIGFALYFASYSTFLTRWGLYLEDLYVRPAHRGRGVGSLLLQQLAAEAVHRGAERLDCSVLSWNEPAIRFYQRHGARGLHDWVKMRIEGEGLRALAGVPEPDVEAAPETAAGEELTAPAGESAEAAVEVDAPPSAEYRAERGGAGAAAPAETETIAEASRPWSVTDGDVDRALMVAGPEPDRQSPR